jgi:hypothetical protein
MAVVKLRPKRIVPRPSKKAAWLGCAAGFLSRLRLTHRPTITPRDLRQHDYSISTQRMGVHFTERIRDTFRFRWLQRSR